MWVCVYVPFIDKFAERAFTDCQFFSRKVITQYLHNGNCGISLWRKLGIATMLGQWWTPLCRLTLHVDINNYLNLWHNYFLFIISSTSIKALSIMCCVFQCSPSFPVGTVKSTIHPGNTWIFWKQFFFLVWDYSYLQISHVENSPPREFNVSCNFEYKIFLHANFACKFSFFTKLYRKN